MDEPIVNIQSQSQTHMEKAGMYKKLGLKAQVQFELEQAKRIDPYVVQDSQYKTLLEENAREAKVIQELKTPLRIGAGMLFVNAVLGVVFLIIIFMAGGGATLGGGDIIAPIVNIIIGVNLWQTKVNWQKYTVWWAALGLIIFGGGALVSGDYFTLITQAGFSGSLILLLAGIPSKVRTVSAVVVYAVLYLGMLCLLFTVSFLGMA